MNAFALPGGVIVVNTGLTEIMNRQGKDAPAAFVSTHPLSADREAALRARLSTGTKAYTPLRFDPWPPR